jgi:hypothetical protein
MAGCLTATGRTRAEKTMSMGKVCGSLGAFIGSSVGWWIGSGAGMMTAFAVSMIGTGLGIWAGRKLADHLVS